jgi:hypothetical protein
MNGFDCLIKTLMKVISKAVTRGVTYDFSKINDRMHPLFVSNICLTFLSIVCISSSSNQVYSLVRFNHPIVSL